MVATRATYRSSALNSAPLRDPASARCVAARSVVLILLLLGAVNLSFSPPAPSVLVTRLTDFGFGDVATSDTKQILYSDAGAASFRIDAMNLVAQTGVGITFVLPTQLSSGGGTVPMSFSSTDAGWSYSNSAATATTFDPNTGASVPKQSANFSIYVWVGGSVTTSGATLQDTYSGSLTLNAETQ